MRYQEAEENIRQVLLTKRAKDTPQRFYYALRNLYYNFGVSVSTYWLKNLLPSDLNERQRRNKINYLLKRAGLKTEREYRNIRKPVAVVCNVETHVFRHTDGAVYDEEITEPEQEPLMFCVENQQSYPQKRHAINLGGGVDFVRTQRNQVRKEFNNYDREVYFMVKVE